MVERIHGDWFSGAPNLEASKLLKPYSSPHINIHYVRNNNTFLINAPEGLMCYDIASNQIQCLGKSICGNLSFDTYVESLVLHKGSEGQTLTSFP